MGIKSQNILQAALIYRQVLNSCHWKQYTDDSSMEYLRYKVMHWTSVMMCKDKASCPVWKKLLLKLDASFWSLLSADRLHDVFTSCIVVLCLQFHLQAWLRKQIKAEQNKIFCKSSWRCQESIIWNVLFLIVADTHLFDEPCLVWRGYFPM